ncbi:MAG: nucleotidyltransferase domain-containing protein [Polyangiaceae bacterium]|nr:nucleotidyltransferase domain-containing protein [Polyangiaceae bacterium]
MTAPASSSLQDARTSGLGSELFTKTQQRVLGLFFGQPERAFFLSELITLAGSGTGAVQREVARLVSGGLVSTFNRDGRKSYKANEHSPIFGELCSIIEKTSGVAEVLRRALAPLAKDIDVAVLFGSVAKETDKADSDVDLLVVSNVLMLEDLFRTLGPVEERLGRRINPTLYTAVEFDARRKSRNPFLTKVLTGKHHVLLGELNDHHGT